VFAAVSAVAAPSAASTDPRTGKTAEPGSHFVSACKSLAMQGFRRCNLVADKLGVSIRCDPDPDDQESPFPAEQVDFPWSSISDVQDPRAKAGLQGCTVTMGIREPSRLWEAPVGALALVLRLPDRAAARQLADAALAFKAYEAQAALWHACGRVAPSVAPVAARPVLLLDERGSAFWSLAGDEDVAFSEATKSMPVEIHLEGASTDTPCCNLCWC